MNVAGWLQTEVPAVVGSHMSGHVDLRTAEKDEDDDSDDEP